MADNRHEDWFAAAIVKRLVEIPGARKNHVVRSRLLGRLEEHRHCGIISIVGIAGAGKTALAQQQGQALRAAGQTVCWLGCERDADEVSVFLGYLVSAFAAGGVELPQRLLSLVSRSGVPPPRALMTDLMNAVARHAKPVTLIVDDLHHIRSPQVLGPIEWMLMHAARNLRFVLASRTTLPWDPVRLSAVHDFYEIERQALRLDRREIAAMLEKVTGKRELARQNADIVQQITEGWPVAVQVMALTLQRRNGLDHRQTTYNSTLGLRAFFHNEIVAKLPRDLRDFMMKSAVIGRFNGEICDAVLCRRDSAAMLSQLSDLNLLDEPGEARGKRGDVLSYHPLIAQLLIGELERHMPGERDNIHRSAARILFATGALSEAVNHARALGDMQLCADLIEACGMALIRQSRIRNLVRWLDALPGSIYAGRPRLNLLRGWISFHTPDPTIGIHSLASIRRDMRRTSAGSGRDGDLEFEFQVIMAGIQNASGKPARGRKTAREALSRHISSQPSFLRGTLGNILSFAEFSLGNYLPAIEAAQLGYSAHSSAGSLFGVTYSDLLIALSQIELIELDAAQGSIDRAKRAIRGEIGEGAYAESLLSVAEIELAYERNDLEEARRLLDSHLEVLSANAPQLLVMRAQALAARVAFSEGRQNEAINALITLVQSKSASHSPTAAWLMLDDLLRMLLTGDRVGEAKRWLRFKGIDVQAGKPFAAFTSAQADPRAHLAHCRLLVAQGRSDAAIPLLEDLIRPLEDQPMTRVNLCAHGLLSIAHWRLDNRTASLDCLAGILAKPQAWRARRTLLDLAPGIRAPLRALAAPDFVPAHPGSDMAVRRYCEELLSQDAGAAVAAPASRPEPKVAASARDALFIEPLTAREAEVIRLLEGGLTNKEMSRALDIAPETIKWHMKNIFQKLGVSNRTQAVLALKNAD